MRKIRILHLEDEESITKVSQRLLQSAGWDVFMKQVQTQEAFEQELSKNNFDLILADYRLPEFDGLTALQIAHQKYPNIPFILFSGSIGEEKAIASLRQGATDYVLKQNITALLPAIERAFEESKIKKEHTQTLQALKLSEEKYRMLFEQAPEGIFSLDAETRIIECNPAVQSLLGYTREELANRKIPEFMTPNSRASYNQNLPLFKEKGFAEGSCEFLHKDGGTIPVWHKIKALCDDSGAHYGAIVYLRDIRHLQQVRQMEQLVYHIASAALKDLSVQDFLQQLEQELSQVIDTTNFFVALYDAQTDSISLPFMKDEKDRFKQVPIQQTFSEHVIKNKRPLLLRGAEVEKYRKKNNIKRIGSPAKCWLGVPMQTAEETIGLLVMQSYEDAEAFGEDDVKLLQFVSTQISGVIKRKYMEHKLKLLSRAVEQNPASVVITDLQGNIEYVNPRFTEITGYTFQEAVGKNSRILKSGKTPVEEYKRLWKTITSGEVWRGRFLNKRKNGELFWEDAVITPVADENGNDINYLAIKEDVTRIKEAEDAFLQISQMNEILLESISSPLIVTNDNLVVLRWNRIAEQTLGLKEEQVVGRRLFDVELSCDMPQIIKAIDNCRLSGERVDMVDFRCGDAEGNEHFLNLHISRYEQSDITGQPGFLILAEDITEWKQMQTQLNQAQKLEAIGQLASGIAHEINTPIQYIGDNMRFLLDCFHDVKDILEFFIQSEDDLQGSIKKLKQRAEEIDLDFLLEDIPEAFEQTIEGINRVAQIVKAMKEFTHPCQKEKTAVDINKALQNTILISKNEWKYVADVETHLSDNLPVVPGFLGELNQVFLNIIVNAAHAIKEVVGENGKGRITIKTYAQNGSVIVEISDTGCGIKEEHLNKIFDPFFTTKEVGKGTGQGLTLAFNVITQKHGGRLWCNSTVNKGTTFFIKLPIHSKGGA